MWWPLILTYVKGGYQWDAGRSDCIVWWVTATKHSEMQEEYLTCVGGRDPKRFDWGRCLVYEAVHIPNNQLQFLCDEVWCSAGKLVYKPERSEQRKSVEFHYTTDDAQRISSTRLQPSPTPLGFSQQNVLDLRLRMADFKFSIYFACTYSKAQQTNSPLSTNSLLASNTEMQTNLYGTPFIPKMQLARL